MKANKLALLGLMSLSMAFLPSCGSDGWKSDAKSIYVKSGDNYATYKESDIKEKSSSGFYYTSELSYMEDVESIKIKVTQITWSGKSYAVSSNEIRTDFTKEGESYIVYKYANASWIIEYKEK
jgi:hypothetical protein